MMFSFTEDEAANFGIFLLETLKMLARWNNKEFYEKQSSLPGFLTQIGSSESKHASHAEILKVFSSINAKLVHAFKSCLRSGEYLVIHNALKILFTICDVFPTASCAKNIEKYINEVIETDSRKDLIKLAERTRDTIRKHHQTDATPDTKVDAPKESSSAAVAVSSSRTDKKSNASRSEREPSSRNSSESLSRPSEVPNSSEKVSGGKRSRQEYENEKSSSRRDATPPRKAPRSNTPTDNESSNNTKQRRHPESSRDKKHSDRSSSQTAERSERQSERQSDRQSERKNEPRSQRPTDKSDRSDRNSERPTDRSDRDSKYKEVSFKTKYIYTFSIIKFTIQKG